MSVKKKLLLKIVSGAQTGVDRAALDAALAFHVPSGGWCPAGRLAEDGIIPASYPVTELASGGYRDRTRQNVIDSDGTVLIFFNRLQGGTLLTLRYCEQFNRPHLMIDAYQLNPVRAAADIARFVTDQHISVLNFAGPRASSNAHAYSYTLETLRCLFSDNPIHPKTSVDR